MQSLFGATWRMDNPLVNFGLEVYQPKEEINLTVDNFATAGGLLRGLFEYIYTSTVLKIVPHIPAGISEFTQNFPVRAPQSMQQIWTAIQNDGPNNLGLWLIRCAGGD